MVVNFISVDSVRVIVMVMYVVCISRCVVLFCCIGLGVFSCRVGI